MHKGIQRAVKRICTDEGIKKLFKDGIPHSIEEIEEHYNIRRLVAYQEMKRSKALIAINKTSYYVLPGTKRFDRNGFFKIEDKVFFSGGTLSKALVCLVLRSHSGMSLKELEKIVCTRIEIQLLNLTRKGILYRQKFDGKYYYFSSDKEIGKRQLEVREREFRKVDHNLLLKQIEEIPLELIIKILLTFIQHPDFSPKSIALSLVRRGEKISTTVVECVFNKYGVCKKNY